MERHMCDLHNTFAGTRLKHRNKIEKKTVTIEYHINIKYATIELDMETKTPISHGEYFKLFDEFHILCCRLTSRPVFILHLSAWQQAAY